MPVPAVCDHRGHWRRRRGHNRRGRRSGRGRRRRGAGSQCKSRNESGRAERPACRDKTHVSPPRVESDTLYQLDTQSRAAQDGVIIAPSRLFSMGNLTSNNRMVTILIFGAAVRPDGKASATLRRRVEAALAAAQGRADVRFIPTGAVGRYGPSEASVMAALLMKSGVRSDRIVLEETGHDTLSSVRAIYRLLREQKPHGHVMVASSAYHLPRCVTLLCLFGIAAKPCPAPPESAAAAWRKRWYWRLREVPALPYDAALAIWSRLTGQL
jgi:vancomycin permeability regulator SanA